MLRFLLFLFSFLFLIACGNQADVAKAQEICRAVKQQFAPDKRVALFQIDTAFTGKPMLIKGETNLPPAKAELFAQLKIAGIAFTDSLTLLPASGLNGKHFGVVNVSVCNIRSEPKHSAELWTQAILGTPLRVWKEQGGWFLVQTPDDYFGWLDKGGFTGMDAAAHKAWMQSPRLVCMQDYAFVYERSMEGAAKVCDLMAGCIVQSKGNIFGAFTQVALPDGRIGFVKTTAFVPLRQWLDSRRPDAKNILAAAREMMGRPYLWGGTSGKGMDCSGFTKTVFYLNGIQLPRDASQQVTVGEEINSDTTLVSLEPGDLLFFGRKATPEKKEKITHVAIYLGSGKIIHASDRVQIESLRRGNPDFNEDRLGSFLRTRRILRSVGKNGVVDLKQSPFYQP